MQYSVAILAQVSNASFARRACQRLLGVLGGPWGVLGVPWGVHGWPQASFGGPWVSLGAPWGVLRGSRVPGARNWLRSARKIIEKPVFLYTVSVMWVGKLAAKEAWGLKGSGNLLQKGFGGCRRLLGSSRGGPGEGKVHQTLCLSMF